MLRRVGFVVSCVALVAATACGPSVSNGDDGPGAGEPDAYTGEFSGLTGTVWAPGNAPGMVPPGHEIPISNALVYLSIAQPAPIPQETYCERCVHADGVLSNALGEFQIPQVIPNTYWLVIQKGQFRIETQIIIGEGARALEPDLTTLPSKSDPANGKWIPRIALAGGSYDQLEGIMGKMGIGEVDANGVFVATSAAGNFDLYSNGNFSIDSQALGSLTDLVSDLDRMLQYHIIFIPCSGSSNASALQSQANLTNIREYVAAGGKLYVTDWSGEWMDNVFPEQVTLGGTVDTPAAAWNEATTTWDTSKFGSADGIYYDSEGAEAVDTDLHEWLNGQTGPLPNSAGEGVFNANDMRFVDNYNTIERLTGVQIGVDGEGFPIIDEPNAFVIGPDRLDGEKKPLTVSFQPTGCGRVLFSTYHTTPNSHQGLVPQERVLLYLIMEIGVCNDGPIID